MKRLAVAGGGSWGTALAVVLAPRFDEVRLWVYERDLAARMRETRINEVFLPEVRLPDNIEVGSDLEAAVDGAEFVLGVMPSAHARALYRRILPATRPETIILSATKGLESGTLLRMSQVIAEEAGQGRVPHIGVLSGPTFAREVARGDPTALVVASSDRALATTVQQAFSGPTFRLYTNPDPVGVEIGGAVKNAVAIGAGVCDGLGLGSNPRAALITRGLAEITRLAEALGADRRTLAGLAGMGDLVLTCTGALSRNRMVGIELAKGRSLAEITGSMRMVAEGVETTRAAVELASRYGVEMPIIQQMHAMLHQGRAPAEAIRQLMERSLKGEWA